MRSVNIFNSLNGKVVDRSSLEKLKDIAISEEQTHLADRLNDFLSRESGSVFELEIIDEIKPLVIKPKGMGVPLSDDIRKKAFRSNGRLNKGFYYDSDGFLTDGTTLYIKDKKSTVLKEKIKKLKSKNRDKEQQLDKDLEDISTKSVKEASTESKKKKPSKNTDILGKKITIFEAKNNKKRGVSKVIPFKQFASEVKRSIQDIRTLDDKVEALIAEQSVFKKYEDPKRYEKYDKQITLVHNKIKQKINENASYYEVPYDSFINVIYDIYHDKDILLKWTKERYIDKFVSKKNNTKQLSLFEGMGLPKQLELYTDEFKKMSVRELRQFTLQYYKEFLSGNKAIIKNSLKEVVFVNSAGRKIARGEAMYKEKAVVVEHLKTLIENSTYNNWGDRKNTDGKDVLGYLNFKSKLTIDGIKRHLRISLVVYKDRTTQLKNIEVGKIKKAFKPTQEPVATLQDEGVQTPLINKDTKTTPKTKNKGLGSPAPMVQPKPKVIEEPKINIPSAIQPINSASNEISTFYEVAGAEGYFLQGVEKKPIHSVVITMDGEQGAGKTTTLYKLINAFASAGNKSLFISGEEHPSSSLAKEKVKKYLSPEAQLNTSSVGDVESVKQLYEFITPFDVIFIDSWQKLLRMVGNIRLDEDLRKRFNGKVFVIIFQQTTTGRTKGGAEVVFDGDIIIKMVKAASFNENYAYFDKNRYTKIPIEKLRYNIATGSVYNPELILEEID